jgi:uncharacterized coiled-coil protein SlyX
MDNDTYDDRHSRQQTFNRNIVKRLEELEDKVSIINTKLERIDDILVVHRNQNDTQRKNHASLIKVWDEKVIPLIEGTHGKQE